MREELAKSSGRTIVIKLRGKAKARSLSGESEVTTTGELCIELLGDDMIRGVRVQRFGLATSSIRCPQGDTGTITILGSHANAALHENRERLDLDTEILCRVNYQLLDEHLEKNIETGCYYIPEFEPCSTRIQLSIGAKGKKKELNIEKLSLRMASVGDGLSAIRMLDLDFSKVDFTFVNPAGNVQNFANSPYDPCIQVNRRRLRCRPVAFRSSAADPNPSGFTIAQQFATAQTVWDKACVDIDVLPTQMITDATLKTSSSLNAIRASFTDPNPDVIEVYFVDNLLPATGGGNAGGIGVASCKVVMAEPNAGNPVLLAHELGHVLNLLHPPGTGSETTSVMQPTGSASNPGTEKVTHPMILNVANPVLDTLTTNCCLSHDTGDHFIRDFPSDLGQEPSDPLPTGMTRYSMSNLWNRRTNTPGTTGPTGPDHESPYRFQNDGVTPAQNFFYARVEQLNNCAVNNSQVKYYLKTPGSGSGAALNVLGTAPVAAGLAVGTSADAVLNWTVPAGIPSHSCCFGVVFTDAEPEGNPASLTWAQFEDMSRQDNDWAQRNLDVLDIDPSNTGNSWEAATWMIELPKNAKIKNADLTLSVGAIGEFLESAEILIPGAKPIRLKNGRSRRVKTGIRMKPGQRVPVFLRAQLREKGRLGDEGEILIDPRIGDVDVVGFGTRFQFAKNSGAKRMWLDRTIAAAIDVADALNEEVWYQLAFDLRELAGDRVPHTLAVAEEIRQSDALRAAMKSISRRKGAKLFGLAEQAETVTSAIEKNDSAVLLSSIWAFLCRAHVAIPDLKPKTARA